MKYLLILSLLVVAVSLAALWVISHLMLVLTILIPAGMVASFCAGLIIGKRGK